MYSQIIINNKRHWGKLKLWLLSGLCGIAARSPISAGSIRDQLIPLVPPRRHVSCLQFGLLTVCMSMWWRSVCVQAGTPQHHNYHRDLALFRLVRSEMNTSRVQVKLVEYTSCSTSPQMSVCIRNRCIYYGGGLKDAQYGVLALTDVERQLHYAVFYIHFNVIIDLVV